LESWEPSQHLLIDTGKPRKTCVEVECSVLQGGLVGGSVGPTAGREKDDDDDNDDDDHNNNNNNNKGTTHNSHTGHCTHNSESTNVREQNILHVRNNIRCT
jgi:hypothetical protein